MAVRYLLLLFLHIFYTSGQQPVFKSKYDGNIVKGSVGSSVNFTWRFSGAIRRVDWGIKANGVNDIAEDLTLVSLDDGGIISSEQPPQDYTGRVSGSGGPSSGQAMFTLTSIRRTDEKYYGCRIQAKAGQGYNAFDPVYLFVEEEPNITIPAAANYNEGIPVNISCRATGRPDPGVRWIHNGQVKSSGPKTAYLTFKNISKADAGMYTCRANNSAGRTEKKLNIAVNYQATITYISSSVSKSWIRQTVTLTCKSDGVPTAKMTWYKPNRTKLNQVTAKENKAVVTLNLDEDFGLYNCTADNGFLVASKTVLVKQIKAPGPAIVTSTEADIQATSLTVKWTEPTDTGGSPITAYRVVILKGVAEINDDNITNPALRSWPSGGLEINTNYTVQVFARNYVFEGNAIGKMFKTKFEGIPAAAEIIDLPADTKKGKVTLKWKTPKDNGAPIRKYTVYQRIVSEGGTPQNWTRLHVIDDVSKLKATVKLDKDKIYEFVVTATNKHGESLKEAEKIKKIKVGDVPEAVVITSEVNDGEITLKWAEPDNNGAVITQYDVYRRIVNDKTWTNPIGTIKDTSKREFVVEGEKGKEYEFAVTATNKYGESSREDSIKRVEVPGGTDPDAGADTQSGGMNTPIIAGAAAVGVLLIIGLIILAVWWKRRKTPRDGASLSGTALRNGNEIEDGYQDVSPAAAAQGLQASGPVAEPNYAEVNVSQKKKNRRPVIDEYAQVDRSKKTKKKPKKQPGELDYAELDDLRPRPQPAPVPSGANARPVVRPPAYEGTLYADIAQFGVPQPEPTYDNMPRKDVVYSNVESM